MDIDANLALWERHATAENRRDLDDLLATLSEDCVCEVMPTHAVFLGKAGAEEFYRALWHSIPNAQFQVRQRWVTGDGVVEESVLAGEVVADLFGVPARGVVELPIARMIPVRGEVITGERLYFDLGLLLQANAPIA